MNQTSANPEKVVDPVCGKTFDTREVHFTAKDKKGIHHFCSDACRRKYKSANNKTKKGLWTKYTRRLHDTRCTLTPPECR